MVALQKTCAHSNPWNLWILLQGKKKKKKKERKPGATISLERHGKDSPLESSEGAHPMTLWFWTSGPPNCERLHFCGLNPTNL